MAQLQFEAIAPPLDHPGIGTLAARLLSYATTMGVYKAPARPVTLNYDLLLDAAKQVTAATGTGSGVIVQLQERGADAPDRLHTLLGELYDRIAESPAPKIEWRPTEQLLGAALLSDLLNISTSSLTRYESGERPTPDEVADRLHFLALTLSDLVGAYNEFGVRRWFDRRRTLLHGRSPRQALVANWSSESAGAQAVR
jgi:hypothetical protein